MNSRTFISIEPELKVKCKSNHVSNYTVGKVYTAKASERMYNGMYTSYRVIGNDNNSIILTIERLMDTFSLIYK